MDVAKVARGRSFDNSKVVHSDGDGDGDDDDDDYDDYAALLGFACL